MKHLRLVIETSVHEENSRPWVSQGLSHTETFIMPLDKGSPPQVILHIEANYRSISLCH